MKKIISLILLVAAVCAMYPQSTTRILNINKNGVLAEQHRLDQIDSMYFTDMPALILASPAIADTGFPSTVVLSWNSFAGAEGYTLQVSSDSTFASFTFNQSGITITSQTVSGLVTPTKYYWRVRATLAYISDWSETWNFTTTAWGPFNCGTSMVRVDGRYYHTVQIGSQCWFKENLDAGTMLQGSENPSNNGIIEKYCHGNNANNCATYGGLYNWDEAMGYVLTSGVQGICPVEWHLPTSAEWDVLVSAVSSHGNAIKEIGQGTGSGAGTNTSGFSGLLGGYRYNYDGFMAIGSYAKFWSSTEYSTTSAYFPSFVGTSDYFGLGSYYKSYAHSVRCLRN
ncbi:MAG: hypothetical protein HYV28_03695 [Ignavibacteriales bacterium]|nr:hypothetical protein [Ignavibacteriales bacterium]